MSRASRLDVGRVLTRAGRTFRQLALPSVILALTLCAAPEAVLAALPLAEIEAPTSAENWVQIPMWLLMLLAQGALVHAALQRQAGRTAPFIESLEAAGKNYLQLLGIGVLTNLGIVLGLFLLVVPGLYLAVLWCVALPAQMSRGDGVLPSMSESGDLTEGRKFKVLALCLLAIVVMVGPWLLASWAAPDDSWPAYRVLTIVVSPLLAAVNTLTISFGAAALYHELRWGAGGPMDEAAAAVFD